MLAKSAKIALEGVRDGTAYHINHALNRHMYPTFAIFQITEACNSKCKMCNIWQKPAKGELTQEEIAKMFQSDLWKKLRWVNLTGGEIFLRQDIVDTVKTLNKLPKLEGISIPTNGFMTKRIVKQIEAVLDVLDKDKFLSVTVSIDGFQKSHEDIRGIPNGFKLVNDTLDELKKVKEKHSNFNVGVQPTIMKTNFDEMGEFYDYMKKKVNNIGFAVCMIADGYYSNTDSSVFLTWEDKQKVGDFLYKQIEKDPQYGYYYFKLYDMFKHGKRRFVCMSGYRTLFITPFGKISVCPLLSEDDEWIFGSVREDDPKSIWFSDKAKQIKKDLKKHDFCKKCTMECDYISVAKTEFFEVMWYYLSHPGVFKALMEKIKKEKNPYF